MRPLYPFECYDPLIVVPFIYLPPIGDAARAGEDQVPRVRGRAGRQRRLPGARPFLHKPPCYVTRHFFTLPLPAAREAYNNNDAGGLSLIGESIRRRALQEHCMTVEHDDDFAYVYVLKGGNALRVGVPLGPLAMKVDSATI